MTLLQNGQKFWADTSPMKIYTDGKEEQENMLNIMSLGN